MFCSVCGNRLNENNICLNCANNPNFVNAIIHRKKSIYGCAIPVKVFIDGNLIGKLGSNETLSVMRPIGNHKVAFELGTGTPEYDVVVPQGFKIMNLEFKIKMKLLNNQIEIISCTYQ